ncbi:hypothetical protein H9Q69_000859 [Fusarium xylarioides]|nr:hypothetical protein H9Q69_000859 [Fusarium xylarioides]KAG5802553.1 hypothetical protein H9Q71_012856 [Fusarium xylarioides]KAG5813346.1 hypothetical protein H9Q74_012744 [Fusarium xylarioides]
MHGWSGWSCTGTIFTAIGALFTFLAFLLMAGQAFFPKIFPIPPTLPPTDAERDAAQLMDETLQRHRDDDTRHLRTVAAQVSLLTRALLPAGGGAPEALWVRLRDGSMTEKEILIALKEILIAHGVLLDSHRSNVEANRSNGETNRLLRLTLLRQLRRTGPRPRGPRRRLLRSPGVV